MKPKYTVDEIRGEVKKLIAEVCDLAPERITDTANFANDLGIDSLSAMEMLVSVEKKYSVVIPQEEFGGINSVNEAVAAVQRHLAAV